MASSTFNLRKFIDREGEKELFEKLLQFSTASRILSVRAKGGDGKTLLLKYFEYRCRTGNPRLPYSLISFKDGPFQSPSSVIKKLAEDLSRGGIKFQKFDRIERARMEGDFGTVTALANIEGNDFQGATDIQAAAIIQNNPIYNGTVNISKATEPLPPEQDKAARDTGIRYFVEELHTHCAEKPAVIMFDTYEDCDDILKSWLEDDFLERNFFSPPCRSCSLILIIAGKTVPDFYQLWPKEECDSKIIRIDGLGKWTKENVAACLRVHGNDNYQSHDVDAIHGLIEKGHSLLTVVETIAVFSKDLREQR
jgi:hypothetical protein